MGPFLKIRGAFPFPPHPPSRSEMHFREFNGKRALANLQEGARASRLGRLGMNSIPSDVGGAGGAGRALANLQEGARAPCYS